MSRLGSVVRLTHNAISRASHGSSSCLRFSSISTSGAPSTGGHILQLTTSLKLQELEKQRLAYQAHAKVLQEAEMAGDDLVKKVEILTKAVRSWTGLGALESDDTTFWLRQAKHDPTFNKDLLKSWATTLENHIKHNAARLEHSRLFGNLLNEWSASGDSATTIAPSVSVVQDAESADQVGRKEMGEQKEKIQSFIFDDTYIDTGPLLSYLDQLFSGKEATEALDKIREEFKVHGSQLQREKITYGGMVNTIQGLLAADSLSESKRLILKEISEGGKDVMEEVASVLSMSLASIESWQWPADGVEVEMRRHLNGKYRAFTDPEIMDALLLHYIGTKWEVVLKEGEKELFSDQLPENKDTSSIEAKRLDMRKKHFLLGQLADSAGPGQSYDDDDGHTLSVKQMLLHLMTTECYLNKTIHSSHAIIRSDFEMFGPSLPHATILAVLKFLGVPKKFLRMPLRFVGDPSGLRVRERGTPIDYAISKVCGEAVMFMMDFAVNQQASGLFLYRMHDDLWIWDADSRKCAEAWKVMNTFAGLAGLKFNKGKTGSACIGTASPDGLPSGDIRSGFMKFDPAEARFTIDQEDVSLHIAELRRQLDATKSILGWVNTYNKYMAFMLRNFGGRPARCFGKAHVTDIINSLNRMQHELSPDKTKAAIDHLRDVIEKRFNVRDLPEGLIYLPVDLGGLGLRNHMLELLSLKRDDDWEDEEDLNRTEEEKVADKKRKKALDIDKDKICGEEIFARGLEHDFVDYKILKDVWELDLHSKRSKRNRVNSSTDAFMTFEEFTSRRESWLNTWGERYESMFEVPKPKLMILGSYLRSMDGPHYFEEDWYASWILSMFGEELAKKFGGLRVMDPDSIPTGMVKLFKSSRIKLDQ